MIDDESGGGADGDGGGYCKPPKKNQFGQPGGNPRHRGGSRARRPPSLPNLFEKILQKQVRLKDGSGERKTRLLEAVLTRIGINALAGNNGAIATFIQLCRETQMLGQPTSETDGITDDDRAVVEAYLNMLRSTADDPA